MSRNPIKISARGIIFSGVVILNIIAFVAAILYSYEWIWALSIILSLAVLSVQQHHSVMRNKRTLANYFRNIPKKKNSLTKDSRRK